MRLWQQCTAISTSSSVGLWLNIGPRVTFWWIIQAWMSTAFSTNISVVSYELDSQGSKYWVSFYRLTLSAHQPPFLYPSLWCLIVWNMYADQPLRIQLTTDRREKHHCLSLLHWKSILLCIAETSLTHCSRLCYAAHHWHWQWGLWTLQKNTSEVMVLYVQDAPCGFYFSSNW